MIDQKQKHKGILLPVFSLPSRTGIGCFSEEAYAFIDFLEKAGQDAWQILPLGPIDLWHSPYQPCSAFAGEPLYIDPEKLAEEGLLTSEEMTEYCDAVGITDRVVYEVLVPAKKGLLKKAYDKAIRLNDGSYLKEFALFKEKNKGWLDDYCLFIALHKEQKDKPWTGWDEPLRSRDPRALDQAKNTLAQEIDYAAWLQFEFFRQWQSLRDYAGGHGIRIIGDMPYYMTLDSVECWKRPELFQLDADYRPKVISGVPGDKFNSAGQIWGSPVYNWADRKEEMICWWQERIRRGFDFYDALRIDHARAFEACYAIPAEDPDARNGHWEKAAGAQVFASFSREIEEERLIAEDLGMITEDVRQMMRETGLPGMAVLQFAFDSGKDNPYRPANIRPATVVYTGTHDNNTTTGWYQDLRGRRRWRVRWYFRKARRGTVTEKMIRAAFDSQARLAIIPLQDHMGLSGEARINTPGTTEGNWNWRLDPSLLTDELAEKIRMISAVSGS